MHTSERFELERPHLDRPREYRVTVDAIAGRGRVYRHGQTVTDHELAGFGELFERWGAVEDLSLVAA